MNERVDEIAKKATEKDKIEFECTLTLRQMKSRIRNSQENKNAYRLERKYEDSETLRHYVEVARNTNFSYGRNKSKWQDNVYTRLRLGYKYYWQLGGSDIEYKKECRLCNEPKSHTLQHYVLDCNVLREYRNCNIRNVTEQIIWMCNNNKIDDLIRKNKKIQEIVM